MTTNDLELLNKNAGEAEHRRKRTKRKENRRNPTQKDDLKNCCIEQVILKGRKE